MQFQPIVNAALLAIAWLLPCEATAQTRGAAFDVVIRGGWVVDGTGAAPIRADVGIQGDRIVSIGSDLGVGSSTIDASDLIVAPGFIDMHSHSEESRLYDGSGPSMSLQGVTTEIYGESRSMAPVDASFNPYQEAVGKNAWSSLAQALAFLEKRGTAANFASYVGVANVRILAMGQGSGRPSAAQVEKMRSLVRQAMQDGALGVSSGMSYTPDSYMSEDELVVLVAEGAKYGGIYATHARTMNGEDPAAVDEAIRIAERAGAPRLHFFHLNSIASTRIDEFLQHLARHDPQKLEISADSYTYTWGISPLTSYIPAWAHDGGREQLLKRLRDPATRARIARGFTTDEPKLARIGWDRVRFATGGPDVFGKLVSDVARSRGKSPEDTFMDVVLEAGGRGSVMDWNNEEPSLEAVLRQPFVTLGTDGIATRADDDSVTPHPRMFGTMPRFLGRYVRERQVVTLPEAIRRMTLRPAQVLGLKDRGRLAAGYFADVVVFDAATIADEATFEKPRVYSKGVRHVLVNGIAIVIDGAPTKNLPGRALRGPGYEVTAAAPARP